MKFVALDVETANQRRASICQIGIAIFDEGILIDEWSSTINPEEQFFYMNVHIHGIHPSHVADAPTLPEVVDTVSGYLSGEICVAHTDFDRQSITKAIAKYNLSPIDCKWVDSSYIARCTWSQCAHQGYDLPTICKLIGHKLKHHDALEDAKACGQIILSASNSTGKTIENILKSKWCPSYLDDQTSLPENRISATAYYPNPQGRLYGEVILFTGALGMLRSEAKSLASKVGCRIAKGPSKKVTMLVIGDRDLSMFGGKEKSNKLISIENLIRKGHDIKVLSNDDFMELVS